MYRDLGFEVKVTPVKKHHLEDCNTCFEGPTDRYQVVYTRKREGEDKLEELF